MREVFNEKLKYIIQNSKDCSYYFTSDRYNQIVQEVVEAKRLKNSKEPLNSKQYRRLRRYEVITVEGREKLIEQNIKAQGDPIRYYCTTDELFDIIENAHLESGHKRTRVMEIAISKNYCNVTRAAIQIYLSLCEQCKGKFETKENESTEKTDTEDSFLAPNGTQDNSRDFESLENHEEPEQKRRKIEDDAILRNALHCMKTLLDTGAKRDEHSIFGEHIANKIRTCNRNNSEINIAQHHIENIVFNLCAGAYKGVAVVADNQSASVLTAISSMQPVVFPKMEPEP